MNGAWLIDRRVIVGTFLFIAALIFGLSRLPGGIGGTGITHQPGGIGGTGIFGRIDGFGSIWVNGVEIHYPDGMLVKERSGDGSTNGLAIGQIVAVVTNTTSGRTEAQSIRVVEEVVGPVQTTKKTNGQTELMILGQKVRLTPDTIIALPAGELQKQDAVLTVSGFRDAKGVIYATRLAPADKKSEYHVRGLASKVDKSGFSIGTLRIDAKGGMLKEGNTVVVDGHLIKDNLTASGVEVQRALPFPEAISSVSVQGIYTTDGAGLSHVGGIPLPRTAGISGSSDHLRPKIVIVTGVLDKADITPNIKIETIQLKAPEKPNIENPNPLNSPLSDMTPDVLEPNNIEQGDSQGLVGQSEDVKNIIEVKEEVAKEVNAVVQEAAEQVGEETKGAIEPSEIESIINEPAENIDEISQSTALPEGVAGDADKEAGDYAETSGQAAGQAATEATENASGHAAEEASGHAAEEASSHATEEASSHASEEAAKHASEEAAKHASEEAAKHASEEAAKHASEEAAKHASEEAAKHAAEEAAQQSTEEAAKQVAKQSAEEAAKQAAEEAAKKSAEEAAKQSAEEAAKQAAEEAAKQSAEEAAKQSAEEAAKQSAEEAAKQAAEEAAKQAAEEAAKQAAEEAAKQAAEEAAKQAAEEAAKQAAEEAAKQAAEEAAKQAAEEAAKQAAEEAAKQAAEEAAKQAAEEAAKQAAEEAAATAANDI